MFKKLIRAGLFRLGYRIERRDTVRALAAAQRELAETRQSLAEIKRDLGGYMNAFDELQTQLSRLRSGAPDLPPDLASYKMALSQTLRDLAGYKGAYEHAQGELDRARSRPPLVAA